MTTQDWDALSRKVYWDRSVSLQAWRKGIAKAGPSYLPQALSRMTAAEFVHFYGADEFKNDWPRLRASLSPTAMVFAGTFDLAWSRAVGGGWNLKPTPDVLALPDKRRAFLTQVACTPGKSIYQIAKDLGLQYRRAHQHATELVKAGKIKSTDTLHNGRKQRRLFPTCKP